jgi:hypothetical protein
MEVAMGETVVVVAALAGSTPWMIGNGRGDPKNREADNTSGAAAERKGRVNAANGSLTSASSFECFEASRMDEDAVMSNEFNEVFLSDGIENASADCELKATATNAASLEEEIRLDKNPIVIDCLQKCEGFSVGGGGSTYI